MAAVKVPPARAATIGRSSECDVILPDSSMTVSRRHAIAMCSGGRWMVTDLSSKHGTRLNGLPLRAQQPVPIEDGDTLAIGPWSFRIQLEATRDEATASPTLVATAPAFPTTDDLASSRRVEQISPEELGSLAQRRLDLLMECATAIHSAESEEALAKIILEAAVAGTGFTRAALVRPRGSLDQVDLVGIKVPSDATRSALTISRSLVRSASEAGGRVVRLVDDASLREAMSVEQLGIRSAICAPLCIENTIAMYLYLDTRGEHAHIQPDAAAFCAAMSRMAGLALANIERRKLEQRQKRMDFDIKAAHEAQRRLMPPEQGRAGPLVYAMRSRPGRVVAGDLFDVIPIDDRRTAFFLGDVSGKGLGAALVMATVQSQLHTELRQRADLIDAVTVVNRYLTDHSAGNEFVSIWVGLLDAVSRRVLYVDAGHGYCLHLRPDSPPRRLDQAARSRDIPLADVRGGIPIGVERDFRYTMEELAIDPSDRLVLFSDGVVDQRSPGGDQFGFERLLRTAAGSTSEERDVDAVLRALDEHAQSEEPTDDVTIASIRLA